ncbi:NAD(P)H-dependent oxidoreductase [uncultured Shimia sp.]|uniref:FMN-dependent NADH-azoreductase n=1 Tax=uncultured Shimia sp. TaxID=573152 RepID=UPI0025EB1E11|nr:NAD(P)H-dependent oxidoreductase [uncultured Shimia sp.]
MTTQTKRVLIIKSSPAADGSVSNAIADFLEAQLAAKNEQYEFTVRDLTKMPPPLYDTEILRAFYTPDGELDENQLQIVAPSLVYINELKAADIVVVASPMHNFSTTTLLKAYIDQICRWGLTFQYGPNGYEGFLKNKKAVIISCAGGDFTLESEKHKDFQSPYLEHIFKFIGIEDVTIVPAHGLNMGDEIAARSKQAAKEKLEELAITSL